MFETVLVGVDGRPGGRDAIALAGRLIPAQARLILASVYSDRRVIGPGGSLGGDHELQAQALLAQARDEASIDPELITREGISAAPSLQELTEQERAELLVVGSSHRGAVGRVLLGENTLAALNGAPCAVAIAPGGYAGTDHQLRQIVVGHDGSAESELALEAARAIAGRQGAAIRVVAVVSADRVASEQGEPPDGASAQERAVEAERERLALIEDVEVQAVYGDPSEELAAIAVGADLLVVGSRAHGPLGRLINGSTSNYLARRSPCPLLVLPRSAAERG
jgi:nucleotide-binding universal stress UspA family protein